MVVRIVTILILSCASVAYAKNLSHCTKSVLLRTGKIKIVRFAGARCKNIGLYISSAKSDRLKKKIDGDRFENIFFFNLKKRSLMAVFTGSGAHTHFVSFFSQDGIKGIKEMKGAVFTSDVGEPYLQYDPIGTKQKIVIKTRNTKDFREKARFCRVLFENMYAYTNDKFVSVYKDKELIRECFVDR